MRARFLPAILAALAVPAAAQDFNVEEEAAVCSSCHGEDGVPTDAEIPVIWGQEYFYIVTQLRDYAAGRRQHEIMTPMAANYDRDQAKALATYFAEKPWPSLDHPALEDGDTTTAQTAMTAGQCSACHGKWEGESRIPRTAGQSASYLDRTMKDFRDGIRENAPDMASTMKRLEDSDIEALSRYLANL